MQESIVQALPASRCNEDTTRHQSPSKQKACSIQLQGKQGNQFSPTPPSSRCTRSQAAPDWTVQEMLVLLNEIAAIDEDWLREISSYQRWKMLSDSCMAMNVVRSSNQCKRKWEMLLGDYMKIRKWESRSRENSYWFLEEDRRKDFGLPASFQKEVFDAVNAVIQVQKHQSGTKNSDPDRIISVPEFETSYVDADSDASNRWRGATCEREDGIPKIYCEEQPSSGKEIDCMAVKKKEMITTTKRLEVKELIISSKSPEVGDFITISQSPTKTHVLAELITTSKSPEVEELITASTIPVITTTKISEMARAMAGKLQGSAEHVCAVLRGELQDGASHRPSASFDSLKPSAAQSEVARRQADELIRALAGLTSCLDELYHLIK